MGLYEAGFTSPVVHEVFRGLRVTNPDNTVATEIQATTGAPPPFWPGSTASGTYGEARVQSKRIPGTLQAVADGVTFTYGPIAQVTPLSDVLPRLQISYASDVPIGLQVCVHGPGFTNGFPVGTRIAGDGNQPDGYDDLAYLPTVSSWSTIGTANLEPNGTGGLPGNALISTVNLDPTAMALLRANSRLTLRCPTTLAPTNGSPAFFGNDELVIYNVNLRVFTDEPVQEISGAIRFARSEFV